MFKRTDFLTARVGKQEEIANNPTTGIYQNDADDDKDSHDDTRYKSVYTWTFIKYRSAMTVVVRMQMVMPSSAAKLQR
jgi:hypothetical protein